MKKRFELKTEGGWWTYYWDGETVTALVVGPMAFFGNSYVCKAKSLEGAITGTKLALAEKGHRVLDMKLP